MELFELYNRQRDSKKIPEEWKVFFEECSRGLATVTFLLEMESDPIFPNLKEPETEQGSGLANNTTYDSSSKKSLVQTIEMLLGFNKRTSLVGSGGVSSSILRDKLLRLQKSQEEIQTLREAKKQKVSDYQEKQSQLVEIEGVLSIGNSQAESFNKQLVEEARIVQQEGEVALALEAKYKQIEKENKTMSRELSAMLDTKHVEMLHQELRQTSSKIAEVQSHLNSTKKLVGTLERQLTDRKCALESNMKQQETIKKLNYELEEKIWTARKERSAFKQQSSIKKGGYELAERLPSFSLHQLDQSSYMTPTKGGFVAEQMGNFAVQESDPFPDIRLLSPSNLIAQMEHTFHVSKLSREVQTTEEQILQMKAEFRFQVEKNTEVEYKLKLLQIEQNERHCEEPLLGKRSLELLDEEDEQTVKAELQFLKTKCAHMEKYLDWKRDQADESSKQCRDLITRRLHLQKAYLEPLQSTLSEILTIEEAEALAELGREPKESNASFVFSSLAPTHSLL